MGGSSQAEAGKLVYGFELQLSVVTDTTPGDDAHRAHGATSGTRARRSRCNQVISGRSRETIGRRGVDAHAA
jgi:hypothetical protein